jgi:glycosyltransferase involved in cell wall biosynthesis
MSRPEASPCAVSVLIPAYNAERTLRQTLETVQRQTFTDLEAIVVDDGSEDATAGIAAGLAAKDPRFKLVRQPNAGVAKARNAALSLARGRWIAPLDADDLWHPEKLARQLRRFETATPHTVLTYSWSVDIDEYSRVIARRLDLDSFEGDVYAALVLTNFIGNASVPLIRRDALVRVGGWDASLRERGAQGCEDWQIYLRLAELGDVALARGFLVGYRQSAGSMSRRVEEMTRSYELVMAEVNERHAELPQALVRWSRATFDLYRFETLYGSSARIASLVPLIAGLLGDPKWLGRRSTRKRLKRWLFSALRPSVGNHSMPIGSPLEDFYEASSEPPYEVSEGAWSEARRRMVAAMGITRHA